MNQIVTLVLTWLPLLFESGLLIYIIRFIAKELKKHFSIPEKLVTEIKDLKLEIRNVNNNNAKISEENKKLQDQVYRLTMQLKGINVYGEKERKN